MGAQTGESVFGGPSVNYWALPAVGGVNTPHLIDNTPTSAVNAPVQAITSSPAPAQESKMSFIEQYKTQLLIGGLVVAAIVIIKM